MAARSGPERNELSCREAGERLSARIPAILDRWEERARQEVPAARSLDSRTLRNNFPELLAHVVAWLGEERAPDPDQELQTAREHAAQRARLPGYALEPVIHEYHLLRNTVLDALFEAGELSPLAREVVLETLDVGLRTAASRFARATVESLREAEENQRLLTESTQDYAIVTTDPKGRIVTWSPGAEHLTGYRAREVRGRTIDLLFTPEDRTAGVPEAEMRQAREQGRAPDDRWLLRKDGSRFFATGVLIALQQDGLRGYAKVMHDATARKRVEEERDQLLSRERQARADAERTAEQLRCLQAIMDTALAPLPPEQLLTQLLESIRAVLEVDTAAVLLLEEDTLEVRAAVGLEAEREERIRIPLGEGFSGRVAAERRPLVADDVSQVDVRSPLLRERGVRSLLGVPLIVDNEVLGVLHVGTLAPRRFRREDVGLLQLVADRAALAIERAQLHGAMEERSERLRLLYEIASRLLSEERPQRFLRSVYEQLARHLRLEVYLNYLVDETGRGLRLESSSGLSAEMADAVRELRFGEALCGRVAELGEPIVIERLQESRAPQSELARALGLSAYACHPLIAGEALIGTLSFGTRRKREFQPDELALLRAAGDLVAMALERDRLVSQLEARAAALAEADRRKDEFLATLAHELRNPLAGIANAVYILDQLPVEDPDRPRLRSVIRRQADHLSRMVDDLLDLSRITHQKIELRRELVDLREVVRGALEATRPLVESRQHALTVALPEAPVWLEADATRIEQIVSNLLTNAAKYTDPGGSIWLTVEATSLQTIEGRRDRGIERLSGGAGSRSPETIERGSDRGMERLVNEDESRLSETIESGSDREIERPAVPQVPLSLHPSVSPSPPREDTVSDTPFALSLHPSISPSSSSEAPHSWAVIKVRDNGQGIGRELLPRIFDLFTQADQALDRPGGGLGIGLTLVKRLVELHGGTVEAHSAGPGHGSEFIVHLPVAPSAGIQAGHPQSGWRYSGIQGDDSHIPATPSPAHPHTRTPAHRKVLVVEDNADAADTLAEMLELWGHAVQVARSGPDALARAAEFAPDVVLLDIGLPGMDGYEVARRLREGVVSGQWSVVSGEGSGAQPPTPNTQHLTPTLVALTGYGQEADRRRAWEAGFDRHLTKPVDPEALRELLASFTSKS